MAITAFKTYVTGEVLLASDLNSSLARNLDQINVNTVDIATNVTNITANDVQLARGSNHGKNLIINADFAEWQRGTSGFSGEVYTADRWQMSQSGATSTVSQQTHTVGQTDVPFNPKFFLKHDVTTGNGGARIQQLIENVLIFSGTAVTLTFWAKGVNPAAGLVGVELRSHFGTTGSPSTDVTASAGTIALTSSFQKFTFTFTVASMTGKTLGTDGNDYFRIDWRQPDADSGTAAWNMQISNVQLELGSIATDFEVVTRADNLTRCLRYFEKRNFIDGTILAMAQANTTTAGFGPFVYHDKRAVPTITESGAGTIEALTSSGGNNGTIAFANINLDTCRINFTATGMVAGNAAGIYSNGVTAIEINAEL